MLRSTASLVPGQIIFFGDDTLIFLMMVPGFDGLFCSGPVNFMIDSIKVTVTEQTIDTFVVSETAINYLKNAVRINQIYPGMTVLEVDLPNRIVQVKRIVAADPLFGFVFFDENGERLDMSKLLVDTGIKHDRVLSDRCLQVLRGSSTDC